MSTDSNCDGEVMANRLESLTIVFKKHTFTIDPEETYERRIEKEGSEAYRLNIVIANGKRTQNPVYVCKVASQERAEMLGEELLKAIEKAKFG